MQVANERALLSAFCVKLAKLDPDVIVGHDIHGFGLDVLMFRMRHQKIQQWSRISRLRRNQIPNSIKSPEDGQSNLSLVDQGLTCGRLFCDTLVSAKEFLRETTYTLTNLARGQLKANRTDIDVNHVPDLFDTTKNVLYLSEHTLNDCFLILGLMHAMVVLPLTLQLTALAGSVWKGSLRSARAERVEYLLLHEFHRLKYIIPEKYSSKEKKEHEAETKELRGQKVEEKKAGKRRGKPAYSGGLVLEPKVGFYDKFVLLLDFNSLYPSIIQEYNICFTTIKHWEVVEEGTFAALPDSDLAQGPLPRTIRKLIERRRAVKGVLKSEKDEIKKQQLDIRQKALKLVANSMYGCLGFSSSRFYCQPLAALITARGRDILQHTVDTSNGMGHQIIYGDTDSIMVYTNNDKVDQIMTVAQAIKKEVNKKYKVLEIEVDGVYKNMLLLRKKKYAALSLITRPDGSRVFAREVKGLDLVRRDWCVLSKDVGNFVLDHILRDLPRDKLVDLIHEFLVKLKEDLHAGRVPLPKFVITKCLTRAPKDYPDAANQAHVQAALQVMAEGTSVRAGDYIPYVVCEGPDAAIARRAFHPTIITARQGELKPDIKWYLESQILPPVVRLCGPIEETDQARLADCLGLDGHKYHNAHHNASNAAEEEEEVVLRSDQNDSERFKLCQALKVTCLKCQVAFDFPGVFKIIDNVARPELSAVLTGLACPSPECKGMVNSLDDARACFSAISKLLHQNIRAHVVKLYSAWAKCNDASCNRRTRQVLAKGTACPRPHCAGELVLEVSSRDVHQQLCFYKSLFDVARATELVVSENKRRVKLVDPLPALVMPTLTEAESQVFSHLFAFMEVQLSRSSYHFVSLDALFATAFTA